MWAIGAVSDKRVNFVLSCKSENFFSFYSFFRFAKYAFPTDIETDGPSRKTCKTELTDIHEVKYRDGGEGNLQLCLR